MCVCVWVFVSARLCVCVCVHAYMHACGCMYHLYESESTLMSWKPMGYKRIL